MNGKPSLIKKYLYSITSFVLLAIMSAATISDLKILEYWKYAEMFIFVMSSMVMFFSFAKYKRNKGKHNLIDFLASAFFWLGIIVLGYLCYNN